jgi:phenylpropionate dioxygenase-like ring-hydroxylating dioxygenase large terminal subunit
MTTQDPAIMSLARRALVHLQARGTDQAERPMPMPVAAYLDADRFHHEVERVFMRLPLALALSIELPGPKTYRAMNVMGVPVLLSRGEDGLARAFINACRHRGAPVCAAGQGKAERFDCPYHAWSYDTHGRLIGLYGDKTFGDIDRAALGLTELPCAERAGLVWVALRPEATFDIDQWLGGFADELATLQLDRWHIYDQRDIPGPGWKVTWDGYLEAYHHNTLHVNTVGRFTVGNLLLHDTWGPHQRIVFARRTLRDLVGVPEEKWEPEKHVRQIHSGFPNLSISGVVGDHCIFTQLFPGPGPDSTITRQTILCAREPVTPEQKEATDAFSAMALQAVRDEDYPMGFSIQKGLAAGGNKEFLFGRNEPALQHYHTWVARFAAQN